MISALGSAPRFRRLLDEVLCANPLQKKSLDVFLSARDPLFWARAEEAVEALARTFPSEEVAESALAADYLRLCQEMLREQMYFQRHCRYRLSSDAEALDSVYRDEATMTAYMRGLGVSLFLWPNHYALYDLFLRSLTSIPCTEKYLEIGPGHGLFLLQAIRSGVARRYEAVDLSPVSIRLSSALLAASGLEQACRFECTDARSLDSASFGIVVACEVLEHVDDPEAFLRLLARLQAPGGRVFLTTCANCPAIDHVYQYKDLDHIRAHIDGAGFRRLEEAALPIAQLPGGLNYGALLEAKHG